MLNLVALQPASRIVPPIVPAAVRSRLPQILLPLILLAATAIRIPGLFTDFWGDEIWSWSIARQLHSVAGVLLAEPAHIDNNHPLNTVWLYLLGDSQPVWLYRLPALLAGVGSVLIAVRIMRRRGSTAPLIASVLIGLSYPLVFYSSEARGYSLAVFFSLVALDALELALGSPPTPGQPRPERVEGSAGSDSDQSGAPAPGHQTFFELTFGLSCAAGFLSHLTFLHVYAGAFVWSVVSIARRQRSTAARLRRLARLHFIPLATAFGLFHLFVAHMLIGGAVPTSPAAVLLAALSLTVGGPSAGALALTTAAILLIAFTAALLRLARNGSGVWVFFAVSAVLSPALTSIRELCFAEHPQPLMVRYFLVCLTMLLLPLCPFLADILNRGNLVKRAFVATVLVMFVMGNVYQTCLFLRLGRGQYAAALHQIAADTPGPLIQIASDNPIRTRMLLDFYGRQLGRGVRVQVREAAAPWLILNRANNGASPSIVYRDVSYSLVHSYGYSGLSGWAWQVYRREDPRQPSP